MSDEIHRRMAFELDRLRKTNRELAEAAKAVVDRWHTPNWKDAQATAELINKLQSTIKRAK